LQLRERKAPIHLSKKWHRMIKEIYNLKIFFITVIILVAAGLTNGQQVNTDNQFKLAVNLYQSGEYSDALPVFQKIAAQLPFNSRTTIASLFAGKCYLQMNDLNSAEQSFQNFLQNYPQSEYVDEAHLALVKVFYKQEDYKSAFEQVLWLVSNAKLSGYRSYAESVGKSISINDLDQHQLKTFYDISSDSTVKPYILLQLAQKQENEGNFNRASETYNEVITLYPGSGQKSEAEDALQRLEKRENEYKSETFLGVLLPLTDYSTGEENTPAVEILEGIKFATAEYNRNHDSKIGLIIRDTEHDSLKISRIADELSLIPAVKAIIGPIFSDEVRATITDFRNSGIPIISPTATDNDLVKLSNFFFQANPSFFMRARVMAQYVYFVTGKRKISVLNAIEGYSPLLASIFTEEFKNLGGEIIKSRTYTSGSFDLTGPVSDIAADSLVMEGIYVPLSNKIDAAPLLSQMVQQKINTSIFGNQDWFYAKGFETSSALSDQLSFTSDYFIDYNETSFNTFSKNFIEQTGRDMNRNVLYGYDTAEYLLKIIDAGADTRASLISSMESGVEVKGYHNNIAFGKNHINRFLNIVRYSDGKFELIDRFKAGE
jgi:branched-chain amino acid transport system substrate-binding protein